MTRLQIGPAVTKCVIPVSCVFLEMPLNVAMFASTCQSGSIDLVSAIQHHLLFLPISSAAMAATFLIEAIIAARLRHRFRETFVRTLPSFVFMLALGHFVMRMGDAEASSPRLMIAVTMGLAMAAGDLAGRWCLSGQRQMPGSLTSGKVRPSDLWLWPARAKSALKTRPDRRAKHTSGPRRR